MGAPFEIERKFIIKMPSLDVIERQHNFCSTEIIQTYLDSPSEITERVRMRKYPDKVRYTHTRKIRVNTLKAIEDEREITEGEYKKLSERKKRGYISITKQRCSFDYMGQTYEIDIYPQWKKTAILEIELSSEEETINIPSFLDVVREVTADSRYKNVRMAKSFPAEEDI